MGQGKEGGHANMAHRQWPVWSHGRVLKTAHITPQSCPMREQGHWSINTHLPVGLWLRAIPGVRGVNPQAFLAVLMHRAKQIPAV